jgi:rhodanese-related sulfurtransferase
MILKRLLFSSFIIVLFQNAQLLADESVVLDEIQTYLDFATYVDGTITMEQLRQSNAQVLFIDTRNREQFNQGHIPNAIQIEWREIINQKDDVPEDRAVIFYCNTGTLSAKAQFIMRLLGRDNIKVLHGGFDAWKAEQIKTK